jgi:hypothetical protein
MIHTKSQADASRKHSSLFRKDTIIQHPETMGDVAVMRSPLTAVVPQWVVGSTLCLGTSCELGCLLLPRGLSPSAPPLFRHF